MFPLRYHNQIVKTPIFYLKVRAAADAMEDKIVLVWTKIYLGLDQDMENRIQVKKSQVK